MLAEKELKS